MQKIYTQKRNSTKTLIIVIKSQENKRGKEEKKDLQNKSKTINKYKNIYINNQIKHEWIKCFIQETE